MLKCGLVSKKKALAMVHPHLDEDGIQELMMEIEEERAMYGDDNSSEGDAEPTEDMEY